MSNFFGTKKNDGREREREIIGFQIAKVFL
jgi:hypothetical protein